MPATRSPPYRNITQEGASILARAGFIILSVWLLNVAFVAVHELGHASVATYFGAEVYKIHISPLGYNGATSYTSLSDLSEMRLITAGGLLITVAATLVLYWLKTEFPVYVVGLRTVESLINFSPGSDMASLAGWTGWESYAFSLVGAGIIMLCIIRTMYRCRLKTIADLPS